MNRTKDRTTKRGKKQCPRCQGATKVQPAAEGAYRVCVSCGWSKRRGPAPSGDAS